MSYRVIKWYANADRAPTADAVVDGHYARRIVVLTLSVCFWAPSPARSLNMDQADGRDPLEVLEPEAPQSSNFHGGEFPLGDPFSDGPLAAREVQRGFLDGLQLAHDRDILLGDWVGREARVEA
jgi:hypothetical protein